VQRSAVLHACACIENETGRAGPQGVATPPVSCLLL
jgi:hypothetical protein